MTIIFANKHDYAESRKNNLYGAILKKFIFFKFK